MPPRPRRAAPVRDDLFAIFPDLPWPRIRRSRAAQLARIRRMVVETRLRALQHIAQQQRTVAQMRSHVALATRARRYR
jgi:hypothetical protein